MEFKKWERHNKGDFTLRFKNHIEIQPVFFLFAVLVWYLGRGTLLVWTVIFVTLHELSHGIAAMLFGAKFSKIVITPIGQCAQIKEIERLSVSRQALIYLAGPALNISACMIFLLFFSDNTILRQLSAINFCIGFFNLLPILPLDGGRLFLLLCGSFFGTLRTGEVLALAGRYFSYCVIAFGVLQLILFPFNPSLLLLGIFLKHENTDAYLKIAVHFYEAMSCTERKGIKKVRIYYADKTTEVSELVCRFHTSYYHVVALNCGRLLREQEIFQLLYQDGMSAPVGNLLV